MGKKFPRMPKVGDCLLIKPGVDIGLDGLELAKLDTLEISVVCLYDKPCDSCHRRNPTCVIVMLKLPLGHIMQGSKWCAHEDFFELVLQEEDTKLSTLDLSSPGDKSKEGWVVYDGKYHKKSEEKKEIDKRLSDLIL